MKKLTLTIMLLLTLSTSAKKSDLGGEINRDCSKGKLIKCYVTKFPRVPKIVAPFIPIVVKVK